MRRTEALQGVRMINVPERFGSLRSGGAQPDGGGGAAGGQRADVPPLVSCATRRRARRVCWTAGSARRRAGGCRSDREQEVETLYRTRYSGFTAQAFPRASGARPWLQLGLHLDEAASCNRRACWHERHARGAHRRKRPRRPLPGMMLHQDGSRHEWLDGLRRARPDRDDGRCDERDLFGVSGGGGRHRLDLPGACRRCSARTACR